MNLLLLIFPFLEIANHSDAPLKYLAPAKPESVIEGAVIDSATKEVVAFAYVVLGTDFGDTLNHTAVTDEEGKFVFAGVKKGAYKLQVSMLGYQTVTLTDIDVSENTSLKLNTILLSPTTTQLKEVEVVSEKPYIKSEAGKIIVDVEKSEINLSGTALEVLQNTPTVSVNQNGDVSVKGRQGVRILVDGKPSPATQSDPEAFLRSIPAGSVAQVEVIHNPGAKYDAEGASAIINIKLKKTTKRGFNAKIAASVGTVFNKFNGGLDMNYRNKKINTFIGYNFTDNVFHNKWEEERTLNENGNSFFIHNINKGRDHRTGHNIKTGLDWYAKPEHTISYTLTVNPGQGGGPWKTENSLSDGFGNLQSVSKSDAEYFRKKIHFTNTLSYQFLQDSGKVKWTADLLHTRIDSKGFNTSYYNNYDPAGNLIPASDGGVANDVKTLVDNLTAMTDGEIQLGEKAGTLSLGLKNETNLSSYDNYVVRSKAGASYVDTVSSYIFRYKENIAAGYFVYANTINFMSFKLGLRAEHTYVSSPLAGVRQNYASFFPEASLSFDFKNQHSLSFNYGRRISRPNFHQLNNFATPYDQYTVEVGNPLLRPQFTNTVSAEYAKQFKKHSLYANLSFSHVTGFMEQVNLITSEKQLELKWINAGTHSSINVDAGGNFQLFKWWSMSANFGFRHMFFDVYVADTFINKNAPVGELWITQNFKMPWKLQLQLQGSMNTGYPFPQGYSLPTGQLNITLKRSFLNESLTVALSCRDVTNTNFWKGTSTASSFTSKGFWKPESQIGYLSISYSFGEKVNAPTRRNLENERLSGGGGRG